MIPLHDDNPTRLVPVVTITVIGVCVGVFLWQVSHSAQGQQALVLALGVIPSVLFGERTLAPELAIVPPSLTVVTSMFLHGGWMHLIGNMLYLWIFGNNVEDTMGHGRFVLFYGLCGVAAVFAQAMPDPHSVVPMIGASGAISGVLGAYLLLYPHARVMVLLPLGLLTRVLYLPAVAVLGFWFAMQLLSSVLADAGAGVAFRAHVGGFLAGMALIPLMKNKTVHLFQPGRRR